MIHYQEIINRFKMEYIKEDKRVIRAKRMFKFKREILPALDAYNVKEYSNGTMYKFRDDNYGYIDFYPMANRLLIHEEQRWVSGADKWIIKNIFGEE